MIFCMMCFKFFLFFAFGESDIIPVFDILVYCDMLCFFGSFGIRSIFDHLPCSFSSSTTKHMPFWTLSMKQATKSPVDIYLPSISRVLHVQITSLDSATMGGSGAPHTFSPDLLVCAVV